MKTGIQNENVLLIRWKLGYKMKMYSWSDENDLSNKKFQTLRKVSAYRFKLSLLSKEQVCQILMNSFYKGISFFIGLVFLDEKSNKFLSNL